MNLLKKTILGGLTSLILAGGMLALLEGNGPTKFINGQKHCVAYQDVAKVWTIGRGLTFINGQKVTQGLNLPEAECRRLEELEHQKAEEAVLRLTNRQPSIHQLAAFTSFTYNVGAEGFRTSSVRRHFNLGNDIASCMAMMRWVCISVPAGTGDTTGPCVKQGYTKQFSKGLFNRRVFERDVCLKEPDAWDRLLEWVKAS